MTESSEWSDCSGAAWEPNHFFVVVKISVLFMWNTCFSFSCGTPQSFLFSFWIYTGKALFVLL